jgi:hypothetical protein
MELLFLMPCPAGRNACRSEAEIPACLWRGPNFLALLRYYFSGRQKTDDRRQIGRPPTSVIRPQNPKVPLYIR